MQIVFPKRTLDLHMWCEYTEKLKLTILQQHWRYHTQNAGLTTFAILFITASLSATAYGAADCRWVLQSQSLGIGWLAIISGWKDLHIYAEFAHWSNIVKDVTNVHVRRMLLTQCLHSVLCSSMALNHAGAADRRNLFNFFRWRVAALKFYFTPSVYNGRLMQRQQ